MTGSRPPPAATGPGQTARPSRRRPPAIGTTPGRTAGPYSTPATGHSRRPRRAGQARGRDAGSVARADRPRRPQAPARRVASRAPLVPLTAPPRGGDGAPARPRPRGVSPRPRPRQRPGEGRGLRRARRGEAAKLIEDAGAELAFLPPYSPDLNPIEMVFSKMKQRLRSLTCRTREQLWGSMQRVFDAVTPSDAMNCYRCCGYTLRDE